MMSFPKIVIQAVAQDAMRPPYNQDEVAGDWLYEPDGTLVIRATGPDLSDPDAFLLALHPQEPHSSPAGQVSSAFAGAFEIPRETIERRLANCLPVGEASLGRQG